MMKLVVALALAAAMPSALAIGKSKACDDPVHCFALDVFGDACQSAREEATTPNGADVALYPQWVPVGEAAGPSLEAGIGLPLGVQLDDPLACWDACVAANPNMEVPVVQVVALTDTPDDVAKGCFCGDSNISMVDAKLSISRIRVHCFL